MNEEECIRRPLQCCAVHPAGIIILWIILYCSGDQPLWAQRTVTTFGAVTELKVNQSTSGIVTGDFNGDGLADIAGFGSYGVKLYFREPHALDYRTVPTGITKPIVMMEAARCNGDRMTDLVAVTGEPEALQVYLLKRNGKTFLSWEHRMEEPIEHLLLADINDDGKTDILLYGKKRLGVVAFLGLGNGTFRAPQIIFPEYSFSAMCVTRFREMSNNIVAGGNWVSNQILTFSGFGRMKFSTPSVLQCPFEPTMIRLAPDANGQTGELIVGSEQATSLRVFREDSNGEYTHGSDVDVGYPVSSAEVCDINGDDQPDIVALNNEVRILTVILNDGKGDFREHLDFYAGQMGTKFLLLQGSAAPGSDAAVLDSANSRVRILLHSDVPLASKSENTFGTGPQPTQICACDVTHDGRDDLLLANRGSQSVSLFLSMANGALSGQIQFPLSITPSHFESLSLNDSTAVIVATASGAGNITILEVDTRRFSHSSYILPTEGEVGILSLHADSAHQLLHILAVVHEGMPAHTSLIEFEQIGPSKFVERTVSVQKEENLLSATVGDFTGDGVPDIVFCRPDAQRHTLDLYESYGTRSGDFASPILISSYPDSSTSSIRLWHHDLTSDGIEDLVCNSGGLQNALIVYRGRKDSALVSGPVPPTNPISITSSDRLRFVDMNSDGKVDIVLENQRTKTIEVYLNRGDGNLAPPYGLISTEGMGGFDIGRISQAGGYDLALTDSINGLLRIIPLK